LTEATSNVGRAGFDCAGVWLRTSPVKATVATSTAIPARISSPIY
jgi:hypothetical protein